MQTDLAERMSPSKTAQKSVTPDSVKALMVIEAIVIAFLSFWISNEYVYNVFFRINVDSIFVEHFTTYTIALGLGIGLAGTAAAATLYKNLRDAKVRLESVAPRIRGSVEKMLAGATAIEGQAIVPPIVSAPSSQPTQGSASSTDNRGAPASVPKEEKR